jgi:CheY-like chemotaxis protein
MLSAKKFLSNPRLLKDVQILVVDSDRDNRDLATFLLEDQGATVTAFGSIKDALEFLDGYIPNLLICENRFLGESVLPLIQRVRSLAFSSGRRIPILVTSTCSATSLAQQLAVKIEAYLLKPIDIDDFINQVWDLIVLSKTIYPSGIQDWVIQQNPVKMLCCSAGVR